MTVTREDVERAIAAAPEGAGVTALRIDNLKKVGNRAPADQNAPAVLTFVGQASMEDLRRMGVERVSIRPDNSSGSKGEPEAAELDWLTPAARREVRSDRNRYAHSAKAARAARAQTMREATSATHGAADSDARPGASAEAPEAPTRPDDGPGSVRGI
jgi:hypothetical protein